MCCLESHHQHIDLRLSTSWESVNLWRQNCSKYYMLWINNILVHKIILGDNRLLKISWTVMHPRALIHCKKTFIIYCLQYVNILPWLKSKVYNGRSIVKKYVILLIWYRGSRTPIWNLLDQHLSTQGINLPLEEFFYLKNPGDGLSKTAFSLFMDCSNCMFRG